MNSKGFQSFRDSFLLRQRSLFSYLENSHLFGLNHSNKPLTFILTLFGSYLVTIMGLVIPWSFTLAMVDAYSLFVRCPLRQPSIMVIIVVGDWVLSMLSLAAACATASSIELLLKIDGPFCNPEFCGRYELSAAMAFVSWILTGASSLSNFWILASW